MEVRSTNHTPFTDGIEHFFQLMLLFYGFLSIIIKKKNLNLELKRKRVDNTHNTRINAMHNFKPTELAVSIRLILNDLDKYNLPFMYYPEPDEE